jgi:outer membrane protein
LKKERAQKREGCTSVFYAMTFVVLMLFLPCSPSAMNIEEALSLARESLPSYKASELRVKSSEELYKASLGPYFPTIDATAQWDHHYTVEEFSSQTYNLIAQYTVFDGGRRKANRGIALLNLDTDREGMRNTLIDLSFNVKVAFFTVIAQKEILGQRNIELQNARKIFEVAEGRYKYGVAKLSDVLQASVRLEQSRFNVIQSQGDLSKAYSDLNSLTGKPLGSGYEIEGSLEILFTLPERERLLKYALERPEIKQAENVVKVSMLNRSLTDSAFFPVFNASAAYQNSSGGLLGVAIGGPVFKEDKILGISATWNLFELGKFFRHRSSKIDEHTAQERLSEAKRTVALDVSKACEDFITASNQLQVAQEQVRQADYNYSQAFGEYKVGKGDILSLVQAETLLANAREQLTASKLNLVLSGALIERITGIESLDSMR